MAAIVLNHADAKAVQGDCNHKPRMEDNADNNFKQKHGQAF